MNSDSDREVAIFTDALKIALQERDAFLERECGGDEDLHRKVEALLRAHDRLGNFLQEPPTGGFIQ
jgi:eukaryotic-like serine/threonine-protein kinase